MQIQADQRQYIQYYQRDIMKSLRCNKTLGLSSFAQYDNPPAAWQDADEFNLANYPHVSRDDARQSYRVENVRRRNQFRMKAGKHERSDGNDRYFDKNEGEVDKEELKRRVQHLQDNIDQWQNFSGVKIHNKKQNQDEINIKKPSSIRVHKMSFFEKSKTSQATECSESKSMINASRIGSSLIRNIKTSKTFRKLFQTENTRKQRAKSLNSWAKCCEVERKFMINQLGNREMRLISSQLNLH